VLRTAPAEGLLKRHDRHDFWSPTQPILPPRHDYGHQVMTGHDHVMTLSHELKSRDLKPLPYLFHCIYHLPRRHMMSDFLYS
jgi:hypothetical protein